MEQEMSKDNKKDDKTEENSSPVVNVEWKRPTWADQFSKFLVDLQAVIKTQKPD